MAGGLRMRSRASRAVLSVSGRVWRYFSVVREAAVAEAFFDGLDVGSAGEQPGGVGVAEVVEADGEGQLGGGGGGGPDVVAEPAAGDVSVGVHDAGAARVVLARGASVGSVGGEGCRAVAAAALAQGVGGERRVGVRASAVVGFGSPGNARTLNRRRVGRGCGGVGVDEGEREEQVGVGEVVAGDVCADRGAQGGAEFEVVCPANFGHVISG